MTVSRRKAKVASKSFSKDWSLSASLLEVPNDSNMEDMGRNDHHQGPTDKSICPSPDSDMYVPCLKCMRAQAFISFS